MRSSGAAAGRAEHHLTDKQGVRLARLLYKRALREVETGKVDDAKKAVDLMQQVSPNDALRDFLEGLKGDN